MIRAAFLALIACLLLAGCKRPAAPPEPIGAPALWVVEDATGNTAGWLFGTIHSLPDGARWRTHMLAGVVDRAELLVVEVRDLDPKRLSVTFERLARDRPGPPLAARLAAEDRKSLAELIAREGASTRQFDGLETWAAALTLARLGTAAEPANGADKALLASFTKRPVLELEGAEAQLAIFDALSERAQRAMLAAVIAEQGEGKADAAALARAWLAGDTAQLERLTRVGLLADPALYQALLARRNRAWIESLLPLLEGGRRPLVAVGAAHLLGADGLPALLAAKGFKVRRIQ